MTGAGRRVASECDVFEHSIDAAFIRHIGGLFDRFAADLLVEAGTNPEELKNSALPDARERFRRSFELAITTHTEMMETLKRRST